MKNEIPPITEPMGQYWEQPPTSEILLDDTHALMGRKAFDALSEYSASIPSGAYEGKMWKRHDGIYDARFLASGGTPVWLLCWFGASENPGKVSINKREILLLD